MFTQTAITRIVTAGAVGLMLVIFATQSMVALRVQDNKMRFSFKERNIAFGYSSSAAEGCGVIGPGQCGGICAEGEVCSGTGTPGSEACACSPAESSSSSQAAESSSSSGDDFGSSSSAGVTLYCCDAGTNSCYAGESCPDGDIFNTVEACQFACGGVSSESSSSAESSSSSSAGVCGDGTTDAGEECDDGNDTDTDACTNACEDAMCGDGITGNGEECDDGNLDNGDGCDNSCSEEAWYDCSFDSPSVCDITLQCSGSGGNVIDTLVYGGHCYVLYGYADLRTWTGASLHCNKQNGYLTTITTSGEQSAVGGMTDVGDVWIGANDNTEEGTFVWVTGETFDSVFANDYWYAGQPDNSGNEDCVEKGLSGTDEWNDEDCLDQQEYICEIGTATVTCGDSIKNVSEGCDDGNTDAGDGCSATCTVESGYACEEDTGVSVCSTVCGDNLVTGEEACDDGDTASGDGCSASCTIENGWSCSGNPSSCAEVCGNGVQTATEACDDGNTDAGDGCSASCTVESGWSCSGTEPTSCAQSCGNGVQTISEGCDDGNSTSGDGCSASCTVESGWSCSGTAPTSCSSVCGNGVQTTGEACDDGNTDAGDGCSASCTVESGWSCSGTAPTSCSSVCGNGSRQGAETCDDGNTDAGDGCSATCTVESGYSCTTDTPNVCTATAAVCGDGVVNGTEECDGGGVDTETCNANCTELSCGDGHVNTVAGEECEDGNNSTTDSCVQCRNAICGDGYVRSGTEQCDPPGSGTCTAQCREGVSIGVSNPTPVQLEPVKKLREPPPQCGDGEIDADKGEICDEGSIRNATSPTCDRFCGVKFCGDGVVHGEAEECEPEVDANGNPVQKICGGKTCTIPQQDKATGAFVGGCRWVFLPSCPRLTETVNSSARSASSVNSSAVPVTSAQSSRSLNVQQASSASRSVILPPSSAVSVPPPSLMQPNPVPQIIPSADQHSSVSSGGIPAPVQPVGCGDGIRSVTEQCDNGTANSDTLPDACRNNCAYAYCGDGVMDTGEQCDDGNTIFGDGCTPICTFAICGNGILEPTEECDDGSRNSDTLPNTCRTSCLLPSCGDAIADSAFGEQCDDGDTNSNITPDACRLNCMMPHCGDGVKDASEQCDDGNLANGDSCSSSCMLLTCGNGILQAGEQCDDGDTDSGDGCSDICTVESWTLFQWFKQSLKLPFTGR